MKKKRLAGILIFILLAVSAIIPLSYADSIADEQEKLENIKRQKQEVQEEMETVISNLSEQQAKVDKAREELALQQAKLDRTLAEIEEIKGRIKVRRDGLSMRLRAMYKNGSVGYLDVLLGSSSLSEFLSNMEMIQKIYKNDRDMLVTLKTQQDEVEARKKAILVEREEIRKQKKAAEAENEELKKRKAALQDEIDLLKADADKISAEIARKQEAAKKYTGGPLLWPADSSVITDVFGMRIHPVTGLMSFHTGIDIGTPMRSPVYASADGTVIVSEWYGGYGYAVALDHGSGISTLYGHNDSLLVEEGQQVKQGQVIAYSGNSGRSTGPHLHFEVRENGVYVDPMKYFR